MDMFSEELATKIDEGRALDVVNSDFTKNFVKVAHDRLVLKVRQHTVNLRQTSKF